METVVAAIEQCIRFQRDNTTSMQAMELCDEIESAVGDLLTKKEVSLYIGNRPKEEREHLFVRAFVVSPDVVRNDARILIAENVYNEATWLTQTSLTDLLYNVALPPAVYDFVWERLEALYTLGEGHAATIGLTRPVFYDLKPKRGDLFKPLLANHNTLLLRFVPLFEKKDVYGVEMMEIKHDIELTEVYNEIVIAYFLQELVFRYSAVLCVHFRAILDWFLAPMNRFSGLEEGSMPLYYQVSVVEDAEVGLEDFLKAHPTMATLRAALFQVFQALEIAGEAFEFTHNDLHIDNVRLAISGADSPFLNRDFLYRRRDSPDVWYVLRRGDTHNHVVKLIDYGRSRMRVPLNEAQHVDSREQHHHTRIISAWDDGDRGIWKDTPNLTLDIRTLLHSLTMHLPVTYWKAVFGGVPPDEQNHFADLFDAAVKPNDLKRFVITHAPRETRHLSDEPLLINSYILDVPYKVKKVVRDDYIYTFNEERFDLTPSLALDMPFFSALRDPTYVPSMLQLTQNRITEVAVVLSFPPADESTPITGRLCASCGQKGAPFCSQPCADYAYHFRY